MHFPAISSLQKVPGSFAAHQMRGCKTWQRNFRFPWALCCKNNQQVGQQWTNRKQIASSSMNFFPSLQDLLLDLGWSAIEERLLDCYPAVAVRALAAMTALLSLHQPVISCRPPLPLRASLRCTKCPDGRLDQIQVRGQRKRLVVSDV